MASGFRVTNGLLRLLVASAGFLPLVQASLPWGYKISTPVIKGDNIVSFDPLSILAILSNPRASNSASRLYAQPDRHIFRWPHMMQLGAVLVPITVLVNHFMRSYNSVHPAVDLFMASINKLPVLSTISGSLNLFTTLPVFASDSMITDPLNFRPSTVPANDMKVVNIVRLAGIAAGTPEDLKGLSSVKHRILNAVIVATEIIMGLLVTCGLAFSCLLGDMWAVVLFGTYWFHWLASTAVSYYPPIATQSPSIRPDQTKVYAVYKRLSGGLVVFKGRQDTLERWARAGWFFTNSGWHRLLHWTWMLTGTAAAIASLACMVNMNGYLQLGFLAMLVYASLAELWLTILGHRLQLDRCNTLGLYSSIEVKGRDKRYQSIIEIALGLDDDHRVDVSDWIRLSLLPDTPVFQEMLQALHSLNEPFQNSPKDRLRDIEGRFGARDTELKENIWIEIQSVWNRRMHNIPDALAEVVA